MNTASIIEHTDGHLRVIGGPGSGKTALLLERYRRLTGDGRRCAIVTYSRQQQERLLAELVDDDSAAIGELPVYTYHRLASGVLRQSLRVLSDREERIVLRRVLRDVESRLRGDFRTILYSDGLARRLIETMHVLAQSGVDDVAANSAMANARSARTHDVLAIYAAFRRMLGERGMTTFYGEAWLAAQRVEAPLDTDVLLIDDFQDVDAGQFALIRALAPPDGPVEVNAFGDPTGARFGFRGTDARFLLHEFPDAYGPADARIAAGPVRPAPLEAVVASLQARLVPELDASSAARTAGLDDLPLFGGGGSGSPDLELSAVLASDDRAEAQWVACRARELMDSGVDPGDMAVIARDRRRYEIELSHAFHNRGVPLDVGRDGRYAIADFVDAMLALTAGRGGERHITAAIASPFYSDLRDAFAEKLELGSRREHRDERDLDRIVGFVRGVAVSKKTRGFSMARFLDACVRPIVLRVADAERCARVVAAIAQDWARYAAVVEQVGGTADVEEFRDHHRDAAAARGRVPTAVAFYTARDAASRSFPVVFVVGCSEGVFPSVEARDGFMPCAELSELLQAYRVEFYASRSREERTRDEHALLLSALTRARRCIVVTAPSKVGGDTVTAPAVALAPAFEGAAEVSRDVPPPLSALRATAANAGAADPELAAGTTAMASAWLAPRPERGLFAVERFAMSPSRLGTYAGCPRRLFYERILKIQDDGSIYLTIGNLFHRVMETIGGAFGDRDAMLAGLSPQRAGEIVDDAVAGCQDLGPPGSLIAAMTRHHLREMVTSCMDLERSRVGHAKVASVEMKQDYEFGGQSFLGKVDRVDRLQDGSLVVIDYKTGKTGMHRTGKKIRELMLEGDKDGKLSYLQVPMYSYGVEAAEGRMPDMFCYYVVPPGEEAFVGAAFISDDEVRSKTVERFDGRAQRNLASISPRELELAMTRASELTAGVFEERQEFPRTQRTDMCKSCYFNRVCHRRAS